MISKVDSDMANRLFAIRGQYIEWTQRLHEILACASKAWQIWAALFQVGKMALFWLCEKPFKKYA